jgi:4-hydroxy-tetrahydrodipicolinate synthase
MKKNVEWRQFEGIVSAIVTPMKDDGSVDFPALDSLVEWQITSGVHGILTLGGTAEYTSLSGKERSAVVNTVVKKVNGRVPVMAGILTPGLEDAVDAGLAYAGAGAQAVMPITPYYYHRAPQEGVFHYLLQFCNRVETPTFIFNVPPRTGINCEPGTVARLASETKWLVGVKECNTDAVQVARLVQAVGDKVCILTGEDYWFLAHVGLGMRGGIIASPNVVPGEWLTFFNLMKAGDLIAARRLHYRLLPLMDAFFAEVNPGPLKKAMEMIGRPVGKVRVPLIEPGPETVRKLKQALTDFGLLK